jgi:glycosyltransferase involved in cell wall biosynthesis
MDVSVVVPTYNRARLIGEAIESVRAQTYPRFEIVVIDDGSTDDTEARIRAIQDPRIRYVGQANAGVAAARNLGVKLSRASIVSFLDSDDLWKPGKLAVEVAFLERHPEVQAVFSDAERHEPDRLVPSFLRATAVFSRRLTPARQPPMILAAREVLLSLLEEDPIVTVALAVRREAFLRAGGFDERTQAFEDWEFLLRLARTAQFAYIDEVLATVRISPDSLHVVHRLAAKTAMISRLVAEARTSRDPDVKAAARRGVARLRLRLGWDYRMLGRRDLVLRNCLAGFRETGDVAVLARGAWMLLPRQVIHWLRRSWPGRPAARGSIAAPLSEPDACPSSTRKTP